jgi:hypothetical protein
MLATTISLGLLATVAGMFLLAKTKAENLGTFFKIVSYSIVAIGLGVVLCTATCGICNMMSKCCGKEPKGCSAKVYDGKCGATKSCASWHGTSCRKGGSGHGDWGKSGWAGKGKKCCKKRDGKGRRTEKVTKTVTTDSTGAENIDIKVEITE